MATATTTADPANVDENIDLILRESAAAPFTNNTTSPTPAAQTPDDCIDPALQNNATTITTPEPPQNPPDPEVQAAIDAAKVNQALWFGTLHNYKSQNHQLRLKNDNSPEYCLEQLVSFVLMYSRLGTSVVSLENRLTLAERFVSSLGFGTTSVI